MEEKDRYGGEKDVEKDMSAVGRACPPALLVSADQKVSTGSSSGCHQTKVHVPDTSKHFKRLKLKIPEFGVKKGLLMEKVPN